MNHKKLCNRCEKIRSDYTPRKDGCLRKTCDSCISSISRYKADNRDKVRAWNKGNFKRNGHRWNKAPEQVLRKSEYNKKYHLEHIEKIKAYSKRYGKTWYEKVKKPRNQTPHGKYKSYQASAKRRGNEFSISYEEFVSFWQKPCFYCDELIMTIGLDRVDNDLGYAIDNIVSCCAICNWMKRSLPQDVFIDRCYKIANKNATI